MELVRSGQSRRGSDQQASKVSQFPGESERQRGFASRFQGKVSRKYGIVCLKSGQEQWRNGVMEERSDGDVEDRKFADSRGISPGCRRKIVVPRCSTLQHCGSPPLHSGIWHGNCEHLANRTWKDAKQYGADKIRSYKDVSAGKNSIYETNNFRHEQQSKFCSPFARSGDSF